MIDDIIREEKFLNNLFGCCVQKFKDAIHVIANSQRLRKLLNR